MLYWLFRAIFVIIMQKTTLKGAFIMLLEFRVKNFKSFKDEIVFSMISGKNNDSPLESLIDAGKMNVLKTAAIYGANASGKSNLFKAIGCMQRIVVISATDREPGSNLDIIPFKFGNNSEEPSLFEIVFIEQGNKYQYGFTANDKQIFNEWLYVTPEGNTRSQTWFERKFNLESNKPDFKFTNYLSGRKKDLIEKVRLNTPFVSVGAHWNNTDLTIVYNWFREKLVVFDDNRELSPSITSKLLADEQNDKNFYEFTKHMLRTSDIGISDVFCKKVDPDKIKFPKDVPEDFKNYILNNPPMDIKFQHPTAKGSYILDISEESQGTKKMFAYIKPLWDLSHSDMTFFVDEFDRSLHPKILKAIIDYICSAKNRNGQLITTVHDVNLQKKLSREQIWFTEKDENGESTIFSLADFKGVRKDENKPERYLNGHYGAVPYLEEF